MKKNTLILLLMVIIVINIYPENNTGDETHKTDLTTTADVNLYPYIYDITNKLYGNSLNGSFFIGARLHQFTVGGELYEHYVSLSPDENNGNGLSGAWNILRLNAAFYYEPVSNIILKAGAGGALYTSAFSDNTTGTMSKNEGGPSFIFDLTYKPPIEYIELKQINRLDLIIGNNTLSPYYYGGINCSFHPSIFNFISLYLEVGVMTFVYSGRPDIQDTALFVWSIGVAVHPDVFPVKNNVEEKVKEKAEKIKKEDEKQADDTVEKKKAEQERLEKEKIERERVIQEKREAEKLETDKRKISSTNILFYPDSDEIIKSSYAELDGIVHILANRTNFKIELSGYTNDLNMPEAELALSVKRVESVKRYLIGKGIPAERFTVVGFGSVKNTGNEINESNRKVLFRIIEEKTKE